MIKGQRGLLIRMFIQRRDGHEEEEGGDTGWRSLLLLLRRKGMEVFSCFLLYEVLILE